MPRSSKWRALTDLVAPPSCVVCAAAADSGASLCLRCDRRLAAEARGGAIPVAGVDFTWAARRYAGVSRDLIAALKFRSLLPAAAVAAELIAFEAPDGLIAGTLVPVPADPLRLARRGYDPAERIALELSRQSGVAISACLRRSRGPRQVGRGRQERLASPPRVRLAGPAPPRAVLIDDVTTTGATLAASARALRRGGSVEIVAVVLARSIPDLNPRGTGVTSTYRQSSRRRSDANRDQGKERRGHRGGP